MDTIDLDRQLWQFVLWYVDAYQTQLDEASLVHIATYQEAGESAMALESCMLAAMELGLAFPAFRAQEALELSRAAGLDEDIVFSGTYWRDLQQWLKGSTVEAETSARTTGAAERSA